MPVELALDLASLALYDIILFGEYACGVICDAHACIVISFEQVCKVLQAALEWAWVAHVHLVHVCQL
jgi:hypothetical protein